MDKRSLEQTPKRDAFRFVMHLPNFVRLFARLFRDSRVNWFPRVVLVAGLVYAISPLDFLADFLPLIGVMDDLGVLLLACRWFIRMCPEEVVREHVRALDGDRGWAPFGISAH